jgi:NAD(P)-dependent dehydrogenase (short-subunit alcohol dehydrogenase family)
LARVPHRTGIDLVVLTFGADAVLDGEEVIPLWALTRGPALAFPKEQNNVDCTIIDVGHVAAGDETVADNKLAEAILAPPRGARFAFRMKTLWAPCNDRLDKLTAEAGIRRLRSGARYLLTGGLGDLSLAIADGISQHVTCSFVLISRSRLREEPDRAAPGDMQVAQHRQASVLERIKRIRDRGCEVVVLAADVADPASLAGGLETRGIDIASITGILHAAGVAGSSLVVDKTDEQMAAILRPKVAGLAALDSVFGDQVVEFLALFSSISAVNGFLGLADYAAANAFLDAYAQSGNPKWAKRVVSVNWDIWSEIGMGVGSSSVAGIGKLNIHDGIKTKEGVEAFFRLLGSDEKQVIVAKKTDRLQPAEKASQAQAPEYDEMQDPDRSIDGSPDGPGYAEPTSSLEKSLCVIWAAALKLQRIGVDNNFSNSAGIHCLHCSWCRSFAST